MEEGVMTIAAIILFLIAAFGAYWASQRVGPFAR